MRDDVMETVIGFGPTKALIGVLARPASSGTAAPFAVLIMNAGIVHRIGPNRVHVRIARHLAGRGVPTFRFDLPGIGDSAGLDAQSRVDESLIAIRAACDHLAAAGVASRFLLFGICSGAGQSIRAAFDDLRIVGAVAVDPPAVFPTRLHKLLRPARKGLSVMRWKKLFTGGYKVTRRLLKKRRSGVGPAPAIPELAAIAGQDMYRLARDMLSELSRRDVRLLLIFTGDRADAYSYRSQLFHAFPRLRLGRTTTVRHYPSAGHTFAREKERQRLEADVVQWLATLPIAPEVPELPRPRVAQLVTTA